MLNIGSKYQTRLADLWENETSGGKLAFSNPHQQLCQP